MSDIATHTYDPPDGDPVTLPIRSLIACFHGWLRFVAAGQAVPGLHTRDGEPLVVEDAALALTVWPTLRDNLERMVEEGASRCRRPRWGRAAGRRPRCWSTRTSTSRPSMRRSPR